MAITPAVVETPRKTPQVVRNSQHVVSGVARLPTGLDIGLDARTKTGRLASCVSSLTREWARDDETNEGRDSMKSRVRPESIERIGPVSRFLRTLARKCAAVAGGEDDRPLPGDELMADADAQITHHVDLAALPQTIWLWLVQMGCRPACSSPSSNAPNAPGDFQSRLDILGSMSEPRAAPGEYDDPRRETR